MTSKRTEERQRRRQQYDRLRLLSDILYDSYRNDSKATAILSRMLLVILEIVGERGMNGAKREALANHFTDCAINTPSARVELGGGQDRDHLYLDGAFDIGDLAKRIAWGEVRAGQTIEVDHENVAA